MQQKLRIVREGEHRDYKGTATTKLLSKSGVRTSALSDFAEKEVLVG